MIAQVPSIVVDLGVILGFLSALAAASKLSPVRWVWRRLVSEPITEWQDERNAAAIRPLCERLDALDAYTRYHLGPNGSVRPIHERMRSLETAHGIDPD